MHLVSFEKSRVSGDESICLKPFSYISQTVSIEVQCFIMAELVFNKFICKQ